MVVVHLKKPVKMERKSQTAFMLFLPKLQYRLGFVRMTEVRPSLT